MSKSNWLHNVAVRGCLIAVLLAVSGAVQAQEDNPVDNSATQQAETQEATPDSDAPSPFWRDKDGSAPRYREICEKPRNKDHADLCQQWRVAEAAREQADIAYWQAVASVVGTVGSLAAIFIALATLISTNRTARRQLRAYVAVNQGEIVLQNDQRQIRFEFQPIIQNVGETPAYDLRYSGKAFLYNFPWDDGMPLEFTVSAEHSSTTLGANQWRVAYISAERMYSENEIAEIVSAGSRKLYVAGTVTYRDTFNKPHHTNFCFCAVWGSVGIPIWITTKRHNDAD